MKNRNMFDTRKPTKKQKDEQRTTAIEHLGEKFNPFLRAFGLSVETYLEHRRVHTRVYGQGLLRQLFVVMDPDNKDHKKLQEMGAHILQLNAHLVAHRNGVIESAFIQTFIA